MSPSTKLPASDTDTGALISQARQWAQCLGYTWSGPGGVFRLDVPDKSSRWRVYSEWAGTGVTVDIDAQTGELIEIADAPSETVGTPLQTPADLRPSDADVVDFARARLATIHWQLPERIDVQWDAGQNRWRLSATEDDSRRSIQIYVAGRAGNLRIVQAVRE